MIGAVQPQQYAPYQPPGSFLHGLKPQDYDNLEETFCVLTEEGWVTPDWLLLLKPI